MARRPRCLACAQLISGRCSSATQRARGSVPLGGGRGRGCAGGGRMRKDGALPILQGCHCDPMPDDVYNNNDVTKRNDIIKKLLKECARALPPVHTRKEG